MPRETRLLLPGDTVLGLGVVDINHMGFPWPVSRKGAWYGVVVVRPADTFPGDNILHYCDALTGLEISEKEALAREGDISFDYEGRDAQCMEWRKRNGFEEQRGMWFVTKARGVLPTLRKLWYLWKHRNKL